ncbi:orotidine-5'-phosphate decarboxylase [Microbacterium sp. M3]|uniref:Orotidine-5'-phosphate decarboxylase n=1 Tax=Microbacterium arthrosphaerae TaxID=792652 RepID=A0ABU4GZR1_9MICO|nr:MULTISPECIES: orotidine-5'-phosphate decarboxylase [Microbacterium]MDW4572505.1 orotidine-5'-phosphate decarboxylase [Microbacterium arthrosphaerae]MDW7606360.1 orotidine-5'-phosphate decarboxylase [Microbacterium sp. M3]
MTSFGERVRAAMATHGQLCVGIDPHASLLAEWGLDASAAGVRSFGLRVVEAAAGEVGIVKPQVSFFECYGSAGFAALEEVIASARAAGLVVIADAKRGDIGSTMDAYAAAWLTPGSPLEADAVTVSPFLGVGALEGAFDLAERHDKGVFVLAATSNPEALALQRARGASTGTVSAEIVSEVSDRNARTTPAGEWASLGFVIGATVDWTDAGLAPFAPVTPILGPGFGHQGAEPRDLRSRYGDLADAVVASESRSILAAGPDRLAARISERALLYRGD